MLLSEFASHTDLHMAEGLAFEDVGDLEQAGETMMLSPDHPTFLDEKSVEPLSVQSLPEPTAGAWSSSPQQHTHEFQGATTSTTPQAKVTKSSQKHARRLSVGSTSLDFSQSDDTLIANYRRQT